MNSFRLGLGLIVIGAIVVILLLLSDKVLVILEKIKL